MRINMPISRTWTILAGLIFILFWYCMWFWVDHRKSEMTAQVQIKSSNFLIDWSKLDLTTDQFARLEKLDQEWNHEYEPLYRTLKSNQDKFGQLIASHDSNEVEVMALQEVISRDREQLNALATKNYLKKRQLLNENQKHNLEIMTKTALAKRQHPTLLGMDNGVMPDHIQGLMQKVGRIWPLEEGHQGN